MITAGYSPVEPYYHGNNMGRWTDVYAVGTSLRTCMEGCTPPPAIDRHQEDQLILAMIELKNRYPSFLLKAVDWSMSIDPTKRPQDVGELLNALARQAAGLPQSRFTDLPQSQRPRDTV